MKTINTPTEEFAEDVWRILINNKKMFEKIYRRANELIECEVPGKIEMLSLFIKANFEQAIDETADKKHSLGYDLIRETLFNWGYAPFDLMAKWAFDDIENEVSK